VGALKNVPSSSEDSKDRQGARHDKPCEDTLYDIRVRTARRHVKEASQKHEEMDHARLVARQLNDEVGKKEADARKHLQVAESAATAAESARLAAQALETEARRKRQEAEQDEWRACEERASAQRDLQSAVRDHNNTKLAYTKAHADHEDAEKEQEASVASLAGLLAERRDERSHYSSSARAGEHSERNAGSGTGEDTRRAEELKESIRKMRALNEEANSQRKATSNKEHHSATASHKTKDTDARPSWREREREREEQLRRDRAAAVATQQREREAEAAAIKQKEKEDREKAELYRLKELARQRAWKNATDAEIRRCAERDQAMWPKKGRWSKESALSRFQLISEDFDLRRFSAEVPLTIGAIPWPILRVPFALDIKTEIGWKAVDDFFGAAKAAMTAQEYVALLEKSQKRFHPDRWRSRKLFVTVMDDGMRVQLEAVVNIVSQAINSIVSTMKNA
jgi:hypothetical protein